MIVYCPVVGRIVAKWFRVGARPWLRTTFRKLLTVYNVSLIWHQVYRYVF